MFKPALITDTYRYHWKKGNIVNVHKKGDNQDIKNHHPVSLLPYAAKFLKVFCLKYVWLFPRK